jgi:hypothetical protein
VLRALLFLPLAIYLVLLCISILAARQGSSGESNVLIVAVSSAGAFVIYFYGVLILALAIKLTLA